MGNGILPLAKGTLQLLSLLRSPIKQIHSIVYDDIDEVLVMKVAVKTKGGCAPSRFDAENCITNTYTTNDGFESSLEAFMAT